MTATQDPTETALLAACAREPDDDTPRLVYADWLEENGQGERAEFVRVQVELARRQSAIRPEGCEPFCPACNAARVGQWERTPHPERAPRNSCRQCSALRRRERELLDAHWGPWIRAMELIPDGWKLSTDGDDFHVWRDTPFDDGFRFTFHRGLPDTITLPTVASLVGGECYCATGPQFRASGMCKSCGGTGRTPGLAATLGRLMGRWEGKCHQCGGTKVMLGAGPDKENPKCSRCAGPDKENPKCSRCMGTGKEWVPGGVLGCVTRVDISDPVPAGPQESAPLGPRGHYGWWASLDDTPSLAGVGREDLPRALWDLLTGHNPDSPATATHWKWWPTPDLARSALGEAGKWFCRMAAREK